MKARGKFKIRQLNPCGGFEGTNLHFMSVLRELVARIGRNSAKTWQGNLKVSTKKGHMITNFLTHSFSKFYF